MCGMVMTERGQVLNRTSIFPLSVEDLNNPAIEDRKSAFTGILEAKLKDKAQAIHGAKTPEQMKRLRQKWRSEETPVHVPHDLSFIVGPSVQVRVAKCFLSYFRVFPEERTHVETLENVRRLKQRTWTHTIARYTVSVLSNAMYT